jgi:hypothetical protein
MHFYRASDICNVQRYGTHGEPHAAPLALERHSALFLPLTTKLSQSLSIETTAYGEILNEKSRLGPDSIHAITTLKLYERRGNAGIHYSQLQPA